MTGLDNVSTVCQVNLKYYQKLVRAETEQALRLTLRMRPDDVWVVVDVAEGSTLGVSSSGPRRSGTPLLLSTGSPFNRASKLLPSTGPKASRFRPRSRSTANQTAKSEKTWNWQKTANQKTMNTKNVFKKYAQNFTEKVPNLKAM